MRLRAHWDGAGGGGLKPCSIISPAHHRSRTPSNLAVAGLGRLVDPRPGAEAAAGQLPPGGQDLTHHRMVVRQPRPAVDPAVLQPGRQPEPAGGGLGEHDQRVGVLPVPVQPLGGQPRLQRPLDQFHDRADPARQRAPLREVGSAAAVQHRQRPSGITPLPRSRRSAPGSGLPRGRPRPRHRGPRRSRSWLGGRRRRPGGNSRAEPRQSAARGQEAQGQQGRARRRPPPGRPQRRQGTAPPRGRLRGR